MSTRLTYTSGAGSPETDAAFEAALADARRDPGGAAAPRRRRDRVVRRAGVRARGPEPVPGRREPGARRARRAGGGGDPRRPRGAGRVAPACGRRALPGCCAPRAPRSRARHMELAAAVSLEAGKSRTESIAEVQEAVDLIEAYCAQIEAHDGYSVPLGQLTPEETNESVLRPFGVFGVIGPFNFPVALVTGMTAGALVAGNTVVLKPSEHAPRSGALVAEAFAAAGLPEGVVERRPRRRRDRPRAGRGRDRRRRVHRLGRGRAARSGGTSRRARTRGRRSPRWAARTRRSWPPRPTSSAAAAGIASSAFGFSGQKCSACSRAIVVGDAVARRARGGAPRASGGAPARRPGRPRRVHRARRRRARGRALRGGDRRGRAATATVVAGGAALPTAGPLRRRRPWSRDCPRATCSRARSCSSRS